MLGLLHGRTRLVGEARWQAKPLDESDVRAVTQKFAHLPEPDAEMELAFWSRGGAAIEEVRERRIRTFTPADMA